MKQMLNFELSKCSIFAIFLNFPHHLALNIFKNIKQTHTLYIVWNSVDIC